MLTCMMTVRRERIEHLFLFRITRFTKLLARTLLMMFAHDFDANACLWHAV